MTTTTTKKDPGISAVVFLALISLIVIILYFGRPILVPIVSAAFLAMLMAPVSRWLEKKLPRSVAVVICCLLLVIGILGIFALVVGEVGSFADDLPAIQKKLNTLTHSIQEKIHEQFGVAPERQMEMAKKQVNHAGESTGSFVGKFLHGITGTLGVLVMMVIYTFLLLFHRERYETFFIKLFGKKDPEKTKAILDEVTDIGQHYIKGRTISILVYWILYTGGFLIFGLKSAILMGGIVALLSIIPYIGGIVGGIFPILLALTSEGDSSHTIWGVVIDVFLVHAIGTYFIEPLIVGGRMKLSAMAMIFMLIAGSTLWGIAGMILFVPLLAMAKIIFDNIPTLEPYGYLVSDPDQGKKTLIDRIFKKKK